MHYHQYLTDTSKSKYGEALARIVLVDTLAREAHKLAQSFSPSFIPSLTPEIPADGGSAIVTLTKTLSTLAGEKKAEAQKENDLIYNAVPVPEATLPAIEKLASPVASPIPIQEIYASAEVQKVIGPDLFARLVPMSVHTSASVYSEEKAKVVRAEVERCGSADGEAGVMLSSLSLPGGLEKWRDLVRAGGSGGNDVEDDEGAQGAMLPMELEAWSEEIGESGGYVSVDSLLARLRPLRAGVSEALGSIGKELENESRECERMRVCYFICFRLLLPEGI